MQVSNSSLKRYGNLVWKTFINFRKFSSKRNVWILFVCLSKADKPWIGFYVKLHCDFIKSYNIEFSFSEVSQDFGENKIRIADNTCISEMKNVLLPHFLSVSHQIKPLKKFVYYFILFNSIKCLDHYFTIQVF